MPLCPYNLRAVKRAMADSPGGGELLCLSTPDLIASPDELIAVFGRESIAGLSFRPDSAEIQRWHKSALPGVFDTREFFGRLGWRLTAVDMVEGRGGELIHDLCEPLPAEVLNRYELVFDCISNQVFDVAACWRNMAAACRPGGRLISVTPVVMVNQGFWNVSPAAYYEFFKDWDDVSITHYATPYGDVRARALNTTSRERGVADGTMNLFCGRKPVIGSTLINPMMTKFKRHPTCKIGNTGRTLLSGDGL